MSFPFEVIRVSGAEAFSRLESLRREATVYPVLLGSTEDLEGLIDSFAFQAESTADLLDVAARIDPLAWLAQRAEADPEYYAEERGDWPEDAQPNSSILGHLDILTHEPHAEVAMVLIPTGEPWQVPCYLQFGGWNECPYPAEHAALMKRWQEKYGAEVVTVTRDTVEMRVKHPPATRADAIALAREQFVYCADIVTQGTQTIDALAASLLNAPVWFFWWD